MTEGLPTKDEAIYCGVAWSMPNASRILDAPTDGVANAMPSQDQILDAIYLAVRDACERADIHRRAAS
jgi:hypothetical protein